MEVSTIDLLIFHGPDGCSCSPLDGGGLLGIALDVERISFLNIAGIVICRPVVGRGALPHILPVGAIARVRQEDGLSTRPFHPVAFHPTHRCGCEGAFGDKLIPLRLGGQADVHPIICLGQVGPVKHVSNIVVGAGDVASDAPCRSGRAVGIFVIGPGESVLGKSLAPREIVAIFVRFRGFNVLVTPLHAESQVHKLRVNQINPSVADKHGTNRRTSAPLCLCRFRTCRTACALHIECSCLISHIGHEVFATGPEIGLFPYLVGCSISLVSRHWEEDGVAVGASETKALHTIYGGESHLAFVD